jgi:PAS domain S-box-containing protein
MKVTTRPTNREIFFAANDLIVSKTDPKGRLTYANQTFCSMAGYEEMELLGQPHSLIRHPDMPRAVFKLLWDALFEGREVFAYVKNMARNGDHYWVFAHVTPSFDKDRKILGFHSNRRVPNRRALDQTIIPLYARVLEEEQRHKNGQVALAASYDLLSKSLQSTGRTYDALVFSL